MQDENEQNTSLQRENPESGEPSRNIMLVTKMIKPGQVIINQLISLSLPVNTDMDLNHCD